jgi:hypothetical protein
MFMSTSKVKTSGDLYPCQGNGGNVDDANAPPIGSRFQLDPAFNCSTMTGSDYVKTICRALQQYGIVLVDITGPGENDLYLESDVGKGFTWSSSQFSGISNIPLQNFRIIQPIAPYYVGKNGSDNNSCAAAQDPSTPKLTIAGGAGCLSPGNTLLIKAGTYNESFPNVPSGTSTSPTVVRANPGDQVIITAPCCPTAVWLIDGKSYITLDGLIWDGANGVNNSTPGSCGCLVLINNSNHVVIQNAEARNCPTCVGAGFDLNVSSNTNTLRNVKSHGHGPAGSGGSGCAWGHGAYIASNNNVVEQSEFYSNTSLGIQVYGGGLNVTGNILRKNYIHNNSTSTSQACGEVIFGGHDNQFYDNIVGPNTVGPGIQIDFDGPNGNQKVWNNTFTGIAGTAVSIGGGNTNSELKNCIIYNNGSQVSNSGTNTQFSTNLCQNTQSGVCALTGNPLFVNPTGSPPNFHLQSGSPAINAGTTLSAVPDDKDGVSRPQGAAYDIGAYEFQ